MTETHLRINMFWHGDRLGDLHAACMRSFRRHGYRVLLHCYDAPRDVPEDVELVDASTIMPASDLIRHKATGSVSLGSNRYRYRLLRAGRGTYADCDVFLLRPLPEDAYLIGQQFNSGHPQQYNGAILRYPADSALADALVTSTDDEFSPPPPDPGDSERRSVTERAWGVWGPGLLTHWVRKLGLEERTQPIDTFYPVPWNVSDLLFERGLSVKDLATSRTVAIHLSNKGLKGKRIAEGTPLQEMVNSRARLPAPARLLRRLGWS